jgi:iron complex outermembrane receptor protein
MWVLKASTERNIGKASLRIALDEEFNSIRSNNYEGNVSRNSAGLSFSARSLRMGRLNGSFLLREILHSDKFLVPDFSTGLQLKISDVKEYFVKVNFSRSSRIPAMNDLYWKPGGNANLKNEYSYIYEVNYEMEDHFLFIDLDYDLSFFRNSIKDMIQWHPGEFSYWTADNIRDVISKGVESSLSLKYRNNRLSSTLNANYSYTRATEINNESAASYQLIYVPEHQLNLSLNAGYGITYATWRTNITGKRYTEADNSKFLPAFCLNSLITGLKKEIKSCVFDLRFDIENIFNVAYETIAWYPLPGRNYNLRLFIQFTNHIK